MAGKAAATGRVLQDVMQGLDAGTSARLLAAVERAMAAPQAVAPADGADVLQIAERLQSAFRDAVTDSIIETHRANLAVPFAGTEGEIVWLHPNGTLRPAREP